MNKTNSLLLIVFLFMFVNLLVTISFLRVNAEETFQPQIGEFETSSDYVVPDKIFSLRCVVSDLDGRKTIQNVTVELSEGIFLFWKNETDTFSMIQNQHNYARLESGSYSVAVNSSARALNFCLSYRVNMTEGPVSILSPRTRVFDNSTLCGFGNYTNLFVFGPEPESWQQKPYPLQPGRALGIEESIIIGVVFIVVLILIALFSKREKSTQEKYDELIDVRPKERK